MPSSDDARLCVAAGLDLVLLSANEVLVQFGTRSTPSKLLRDPDLTGLLATLVHELAAGSRTLGELVSSLEPGRQAEGRDLIEDLVRQGILADEGNSPVEQYIAYTFTGESSLADRSVALIGTGPLGSRLAHSLVQHGIGRLALLDGRPADDTWFPLGLERGAGAVGRADAALADRLTASGSTDVRVLGGSLDAAGVEAAVSSAEFVILCLEQPDPRLAHLVNRYCIRAQRPWLLATIDGNLGLVGPLFIPVHTACYADYLAVSDAAVPSPQMARRYRRHVMERAPHFFPGLPAYAEIVSGWASLGALHFLLREASFAVGRVLVVDFDSMVVDVEDVLKLPRCPVCSATKSAYQPAFSGDLVTRAPVLARAEPSG